MVNCILEEDLCVKASTPDLEKCHEHISSKEKSQAGVWPLSVNRIPQRSILVSAKKRFPEAQKSISPISNIPFLQYAKQLRCQPEMYETESNRRFPRLRLQPGIPQYSLTDAGKTGLFIVDSKHLNDCSSTVYSDHFKHWAPDNSRISSKTRCHAFMKTSLKPHGDPKLRTNETTHQYLSYSTPVPSTNRDYTKLKCSSIPLGDIAPGNRLPDSTANEHFIPMTEYLKRPKINKKSAYDISSICLYQPDCRLLSFQTETRNKFEIPSLINCRPSPAQFPALNVLGLNCKFDKANDFKRDDYLPFPLDSSHSSRWIENRNELGYQHHDKNRDLRVSNTKSITHSDYLVSKPQPKRIAHKVNDVCQFNIGPSNGEKVDYSITTHSQDYIPFEVKRPKKLAKNGHIVMGRPDQFPIPISSMKHFHVAYPKGDCWDNPPDYPCWKNADDGKPTGSQSEMSTKYGLHKGPRTIINKEAKEKLKYTTTSINLCDGKSNTYETTYGHYHKPLEAVQIIADFKKPIDLPKTPQELATVLNRIRNPITGCTLVK